MTDRLTDGYVELLAWKLTEQMAEPDIDLDLMRDSARALRQLMEERRWRPISEAPKDGRDLIVWNGDCRTISCWGKVSHVPIYGWLNMTFVDPENVDLLDPQPTHFMELPDQPAQEGAE